MNKCCIYFISLQIILIISLISYKHIKKYSYLYRKNLNDSNFKESSNEYYEYLFNSIEYDYYNLSMIYNESYNSIKIKHKSNKRNSLNRIVCVFGILVNERGIKISNSMLEWLLPEYDVYCIYQKYPGILYEYPALRFAQWISLNLNISILLYIHTKGASHPIDNQKNVRSIWKHEFTKPRNNIYIKIIEKNIVDISLPFRSGACTWFNGMFISNRAFKLINTIEYNKDDRWFYERLFAYTNNPSVNIRFKGILNDTIFFSNDAWIENNRFLRIFKKEERNRKEKNTKVLFIYFCILLLIVIFKFYNNLKNKFRYK